MRRLFKFLAWVLGGATLLVLVLAVALLLLIDPNNYKKEIADTVKHHTGRQLILEGDLSLSVFPWLGVQTGPLRLLNPTGFSDQAMLSVASSRVRLKLIPLLRKEFQLDTIELREPVIRLSINAAGQNNWSDLTPQGTPDREQKNRLGTLVGAIAINGLILNDGSVFWNDAQSGTHYQFTELHIETGRVLNMVPVDVKIRGVLAGDTPNIKLAVRSTALLDANKESLQFADTQLTFVVSGISGAVQAKTIRVDSSEQAVSLDDISSTLAYAGESYQVKISRLGLQQKGMVGRFDEIRISGRYSDIDVAAQLTGMVANLERQALAVPTFSLRANDAKVTGLMSAHQILTQPQMQGRIQTNQFDLRKILQSLQLDWQAEDQAALTEVQLVSELELSTDKLTLKQFQAQFDATRATGFLAIKDFGQPNYHFDLRLSELDVDRYLPAQQTATQPAATPGAFVLALPAVLFRELDANGVVTVGAMRVSGLTIQNVVVGVRSKDRVVSVEPISAELYGGKLNGAMQLDTRKQARITVRQSLTGVRIGPVLTAAKITDRIDGVGNLQLSAAAEQLEAGRSVKGEARFDLQQGVIKGVNLRKLVLQARDIYARAKGREPVKSTVDASEEQFEFTELGGSVQFDERTATNQDLKIKSPLLRVLGSGSADLVRRNLDYAIDVYVVESARGQGGEELAQLRGIPIPINVAGSFQEPIYRLNVERLLKLALQKQLEKKQDKLQRKLENKLQNKLEKLLQ